MQLLIDIRLSARVSKIHKQDGLEGTREKRLPSNQHSEILNVDLTVVILL